LIACKRCAAPLASDALVCVRCHALIHSEGLEQISATARLLEDQRDFKAARDEWSKAVPLLPLNSRQAAWIQTHVERLAVSVNAPPPVPTRSAKWPKWLAPAVPIVVALSKGKAILALFNAKFLLSFGAFLGVYWSLYGIAFALGFAGQILIHEMGHYVDIRRRGLPADMPLFLPGLGAFVRWNALGVSLETRAAVSLAGPLAGLMAAATCGTIWLLTGNAIWGALARSGAWLNLLNLIPVWGLDGSHAFLALAKRDRGILLVSALTLFLLVHDGVLVLVALGAIWRMFTKDLPEHSSPFTLLYFSAVLAGLGALVWLVPGHGFGTP
jgi:Zn-dependent protease